METMPAEIPCGHVDQPDTVQSTLESLRTIHGPDVEFSLQRWDDHVECHAGAGRISYMFVIEAEDATVGLSEGDLVRGPAPDGPYLSLAGAYGEATGDHEAEVLPGDVLTVRGEEPPLTLTGRGVYFEVVVEETDYPAPRMSMLRNLESEPGGCASYDQAFRREALPPHDAGEGEDRRGANRVNEHTLDMRVDREPGPIKHYHGPVRTGNGRVNHTETAIVLPRSAYGLPPFEGEGDGRVKIYRQPADDPTDTFTVPVRPGSILVTPATEERVYGHCFENAFAMLVAIPGFVAPLNYIDR